MRNVYIKTLGCKVNAYDSEVLVGQLLARGFKVTDQVAEADVAVINSCSVTAKADQETRHLARRFRRANPNSVVVVTGCYAQTDSARLAAMDEIDLVVPNAVKEQFGDLVHQKMSGQTDPANKIPDGLELVQENRQEHFKSSITLFDHPESQRTRTFLKIQDGCNGFCTYCLIPYARGASRSVPLPQVLKALENLAGQQVPEVVLTGIHIGDYGHDHGEPEGLAHLLRRALTIPGIPRIRISSLEPSEVTPALLEVFKAARDQFCPHFHLPLQSGSNRILRLMRRSYKAEEYLSAIESLRRIFPRSCIGADVIPGFPGETDDDHKATLDLLNQCNVNYLHVFPYSARPNTAALKMPGHLHGDIVRQRAAALRQWSDDAKLSYSRNWIGETVQALWEKDWDEAGRCKGRTAEYVDVVAGPGVRAEPGEFETVVLVGLVANGSLLAKKL